MAIDIPAHICRVTDSYRSWQPSSVPERVDHFRRFVRHQLTHPADDQGPAVGEISLAGAMIAAAWHHAERNR